MDPVCIGGFWLVLFLSGARHYTDDLRTVPLALGPVQRVECRPWDSLPPVLPALPRPPPGRLEI